MATISPCGQLMDSSEQTTARGGSLRCSSAHRSSCSSVLQTNRSRARGNSRLSTPRVCRMPRCRQTADGRLQQQSMICELLFPLSILSVKLNRKSLVIVLKMEIYHIDLSLYDALQPVVVRQLTGLLARLSGWSRSMGVRNAASASASARGKRSLSCRTLSRGQ